MTITLDRSPAETVAPAQQKRGKKAAATAPPAPGTLSLTISQTSLAGALAKVTRAVGNRNLPILNNVKLTATAAGELELACTDLGIAIVAQTVADVASEGAYTVPAKLLAEFVGTLPNQPVTLRLDGTVLRIECGRAKAQIKGSPIDDFPELPVPKDGQPPHAILDAEALNKAIALASIAPSPDPLVGIQNAIHIQNAEAMHVEAATSGRASLIADAIDVTENAPGAFDVLIPLRGAQEIARLAIDGNVSAWLLPRADDPNIIVLRSENATVAVRLLQGQFYDLERLVPKDFVLSLALARVPLLAAVKQALLFSDANDKGFQPLILRVAGEGESGVVNLSANGVERGSGDSEVSATVDGTPFAFALNGPYVRDVLGALDGDSVLLRLSGQLSPVLVTDPELTIFRHIIMPMFVAGVTDAAKDEEPEASE